MMKFKTLIGLLGLAAFFSPSAHGDPLEENGDYGIYRKELSIPNPHSDSIKGEITAPSLDGGWTIADGSHPLVVILPGFQTTYKRYDDYTTHLASHGFMVLGMDFPKSGILRKADHERNAKEVIVAIDYILHPSNGIERYIESDSLAAMGHSIGGKLSFYAASMDSRIRAVVALDPQNSGGPPCFISPKGCHKFPVAPNPKTGQVGVIHKSNARALIFRAPPDRIINPESQFNAEHFWRGLTTGGYYLDFPSTGHMAWLRSDNIKRISKRSMLAFLMEEFFDHDMTEYFSGSIMQRDVDLGTLKKVGKK